MNDLLARACESYADYLALGNHDERTDVARFVTHFALPDIWDANHVSCVRAASSDEIDGVLSRSESTFQALHHRRFLCDPLTPPAFEARLVLDDYVREEELELLLEGELELTAPDVDLREAKTAADWEALLALEFLDHAEEAEKEGRPAYAEGVTRRMVEGWRAKGPDQRFWLARADGRDCGFFASWPGRNGIGKVENLFVHPDWRRRGIASALMRHAVTDARTRGAGPVLIGARVDDTPKHWYARLGFRPAFVMRSYRKHPEHPGEGS